MRKDNLQESPTEIPYYFRNVLALNEHTLVASNQRKLMVHNPLSTATQTLLQLPAEQNMQFRNISKLDSSQLLCFAMEYSDDDAS